MQFPSNSSLRLWRTAVHSSSAYTSAVDRQREVRELCGPVGRAFSAFQATPYGLDIRTVELTVVLENSVCDSIKRERRAFALHVLTVVTLMRTGEVAGHSRGWHSEIKIISECRPIQQLCLMTTERSEEWNSDET